MRRICAHGLALALIAAVATPAAAQKYPARTGNVIVPYPACGSVDGVARILVQKLNETVGQHFIVENRAGGASGTVCATAVARAAPDGYTLMVSASVHVINPFLYKNIPYDVVKDFTPVTLLADGPLIVSTTPSVTAGNLKDFFEQVSHLAVELLKRDAGLDTLVIPYKGTAPALTDLVGGQIQLLADPMLSSLPLARAGKIKALGLTSLKRAAAAPEIPTVEESGMKGFEFVSWYGLWGPRNLPPEVSAYLQEASAKVLALPDVKQRLAELGFDPIASTSVHFAKYIDTEMAKYAAIIRDAKIGVQQQQDEFGVVMPGLVPGIHVLKHFRHERRGWPGQARP